MGYKGPWPMWIHIFTATALEKIECIKLFKVSDITKINVTKKSSNYSLQRAYLKAVISIS